MEDQQEFTTRGHHLHAQQVKTEVKTQIGQSCNIGIKVFVGSKNYTHQFYQIFLGLQKWVVTVGLGLYNL
jgi:hypothetical protein